MLKKAAKIILPLGIILGVFLGLVITISSESLATFGATANPDKMNSQSSSSRYYNGKFHNEIEHISRRRNFFKILQKFYFAPTGKREPSSELAIKLIDPKIFNQPVKNGVRITWLGHSAILIEMEGYRILTDPVFSERASPFQWIGPKRFHPVPVTAQDLPELDVIVISHDHYDHLDYHTIKKLAQKTKKFIVPLGVGVHLLKWGISANKIIERDWWQEAKVYDNLKFVATPAQHFSGRSLFDRNTTLWSSWVIKSDKHSIYFSGDTGMFGEFKTIGKRYGPFDYTLLHVGAYSNNWPDVHMTPEEAVQAHIQLKGKVFVPIHWGTFSLAFHDWNEPPERLFKAATMEKLKFVIPMAGQHISNSSLPAVTPWWREAG